MKVLNGLGGRDATPPPQGNPQVEIQSRKKGMLCQALPFFAYSLEQHTQGATRARSSTRREGSSLKTLHTNMETERRRDRYLACCCDQIPDSELLKGRDIHFGCGKKGRSNPVHGDRSSQNSLLIPKWVKSREVRLDPELEP